MDYEAEVTHAQETLDRIAEALERIADVMEMDPDAAV